MVNEQTDRHRKYVKLKAESSEGFVEKEIR